MTTSEARRARGSDSAALTSATTSFGFFGIAFYADACYRHGTLPCRSRRTRVASAAPGSLRDGHMHREKHRAVGTAPVRAGAIIFRHRAGRHIGCLLAQRHDEANARANRSS